jgi:hypothetical protein
MAQVLDFTLVPKNEMYIPSAMSVLNTIVIWEANLLHRTSLEMMDGSVLKEFSQAMKDSTVEEWASFKQGVDFKPLEHAVAERLLIDGSGLVRNTGFEAWVLGETNSPISPEAPGIKAMLLGSKES